MMLPVTETSLMGAGGGTGGLGCFSFVRSFIQQIFSLYPVTNTASCWEYKVEQDRLPSCPHGVRFCLTWIGITVTQVQLSFGRWRHENGALVGAHAKGSAKAPTRVSKGPGGGQGSLAPLKAQPQSTPLCLTTGKGLGSKRRLVWQHPSIC